MKFDSSDIITILQKFNKVEGDSFPRDIKSIQKLKPHDKNVLITFIFKGKKYAILIDNSAEDDDEYIHSQITSHISGSDNYQLVNNPSSDDFLTFGLPYKGKDCYLLESKSDKKRLDILLVEKFGKESRSTYQKMITAGQVLVDGKIAKNAKQLVGRESNVKIESKQQNFIPIKYETIYEDDDIIVINKPAGMLTHAKGAIAEEFTAADIVKPITNYKADTNRPGIIHRLDRNTSGVLLMVKNSDAASKIQKQFSQRTIKKTYYAIVCGIPDQHKAFIDLPIERNPSRPSTFRVGANGKSAQTSYEVERSIIKKNISLIKLQPKTGRTHQLRVHMQYLNTPILGDLVYGGKPAERMFLHAESLEVTLLSGERKVFKAPLPDEFNQLMDK